MILEYWYSQRCTRQIKLFITIGTCIAIYISTQYAELSLWYVGFSLLIGLSLHLIRTYRVKIQKNNPKLKAVQWLIFIPMIMLIGLVLRLPNEPLLPLAIQTIGFATLGFFIVTLHQQRVPR